MECIVCQKHADLKSVPGGPIYSDENVFIAHFPLLEDSPAHYGHVIIELSRHITRPTEMSDLEATSVGLFLQRISRGLEVGLSAEHIYIVRIGDKTPHLHFHLIPRFRNTPKEFWGPLLFQWPGGRKATAKDMVQITEILKKFL